VNYNNFRFWILFGLVYLVYWRLDRRRQNTLLLVASYVFYGAWDYRFLFLILLSTVIDFIGGLGVAGVELPARKRRNLGVLLIGSSILLTSGIHYDLLFAGDLAAALPLHARDWAIPLATLFATVAYGVFLPRLYRLPTERGARCSSSSAWSRTSRSSASSNTATSSSTASTRCRHVRAGHASWTTLN
jgi:D-alanyl-lipoteichoic acid acyltransferase DltB (MBOAT superfamily)